MATADVPAEIESKLAVPDAATLRAIGRRVALSPYRLVPRGRQRLRTVYLDTRGLVLTRHGLALRVRGLRGRWDVTLKWPGEVKGDLHDRPELTLPLAGEPRFLFDTVFDERLHRHVASLVAGRKLLPILETDIDRQRVDVCPVEPADADGCAEMALDEVRIRRPGVPTVVDHFFEVEIERTGGSTEDVCRAAAVLQNEHGLVASASTKFGRGIAALYPRLRPRSAAARAKRGDSAVVAVRHVIARQLERMRAAVPGARLGADPEELHDLRVALRRLRTAVRAFAAVIPDADRSSLEDDLRWLATALGAGRALDVLLVRVDEFEAVAPSDLRGGTARFREALVEERRTVQAELLRVLDSRRGRRLVLSLERLAEGPRRGGESTSIGEIGAAAVRRARARLGAAGRDARNLGPEQMHRLRIRGKRLRYVLEFVADLVGKPARRAIADLTELQGILGSYHDAVEAASAIRARATAAPMSSSDTMLLGAMVGVELWRAEEARRGFARAWKKLRSAKRRRHLDRVLKRLDAMAAPGHNPPRNHGKKTAAPGGPSED